MTLDGEAARQNARYDALTLEIMRRTCVPTSNCLDVGAADGEILRSMVAAAPAGRHFAIEPLPRCAATLRAGFPQVTVWEAAASDTTGRAGFVHVVSNPAYSGLHERPYHREDEVLASIEVMTVRLDDVVPPDVSLDFVKIDVEGGEVLVLRGARELLRRSRPVIVFEHGGDWVMRHYGTTSAELWRILVEELGYGIGLLDGSAPLSWMAFQESFVSEYYFVAADW
ncbi:hypothetical protein GCM10010517_05380 [Streptosporangium fragile]|uniref:Methyltransferase FkbM domain-containing protein n=1 Tax=Streptosporangium fragile TaxID=46186 RepID=A0ABN3VPV0_9ACTN